MIATFYILPESVSQQNLNNEEFLCSLENFISEYHNLVEYKNDNKIYIQSNVFEVILSNGKTLGDFLYTVDSTINGKEKSIKQFLSNLFNKISLVDIDINEIKNKIQNNSINECTGVISLTKIDKIADENQIVYSKGSWFNFRRYYLGIFHGQSEYFVDECKKYFPDLFFHEKNYTSIKPILRGFSSKIVFHLTCLHDILPKFLIKNIYSNHTVLLKEFSTKANLDQDATLEGSKKSRLKFNFENNKKVCEKLVCEPHLKLSKNDSNDGVFYDHRIYFHLGKENIHNSKILIAHIGVHL